MSKATYYHIAGGELVEGTALGRITVVLGANFDTLAEAYVRAGEREHALRVELHNAKQKLAERDALLLRITGSDHQDSLRAIGEAAALSASAGPNIKRVRAHKHTCANVQPGSTSTDVCDCGAMADGKPVEVEPVAFQWRCKTVNEGSQWRHWVDCTQEDYNKTIENPGPSPRGIIREARKLYTHPAEQPEPISLTSDKYKAELYDEVWQLARGMGFGNVTDALMKLQSQLQGKKSR